MKNSFVLKVEVDDDVWVAVRQRNDFWRPPGILSRKT